MRCKFLHINLFPCFICYNVPTKRNPVRTVIYAGFLVSSLVNRLTYMAISDRRLNKILCSFKMNSYLNVQFPLVGLRL